MMSKHSTQNGFVLISSYLALSTMMIFSLSLWMRHASMSRNAEETMNRLRAFHLAESALDQAIVNLEANITYTGVNGVNYAKNGQTIGSYDILVESPDANNSLMKRITATGTTPNLDGAGRGLSTRTIVCYLNLVQNPTFQFAIFADEKVDLQGSPSLYIDSYDSRLADYSLATARAKADVGTNGTGNGVVSLTGNVTVKGDVTVGPGGNPATAITVGNNASISGTTGAAIEPLEMEESKVPKSIIQMGSVSLTGEEVLPSGNYSFDSLSITGNGSLKFSGPANIYLKGTSYIGGNGVLSAFEVPKNLIIHVIGTQEVTYAGNGDFHGAIYGPKANVKISGNGEMFGAVLSKNITSNGNGKIHFDESLKDAPENPVYWADIVAWQESNKQMS